jgi:hypothetical protein
MKVFTKSWMTALLTLICVMILIMTDHGSYVAGIASMGILVFFTFIIVEANT